MSRRARERCRERLERLALAELGPEEARRTAIEELRRAIGFDRWCWPLTDPDSGLSTNGIGDVNFWPSLARMVALEEHGDITSKPSLVTGRQASAALSAVTRGNLARSRRWRECLQPYGIGDELMTVCRDRHGCWGSVELMRDSGDAPFNEDEIRLLHDLAPTLGTLVRRSLPQTWQTVPAVDRSDTPGTLILDDDLRPAGRTKPFGDWIAELPSADLYERLQILPTAVYEIGARLLAPPEAHSGLPNRVRIRTATGRWAVLEGAVLEGGAGGRVVITVRAATSEEVFDLLGRVHELTQRERQLVPLMLNGLATRELAEALHISPYTVQDHLKAVFFKTGVRSRRELISRLAF